jgi:hypothetical protein
MGAAIAVAPAKTIDIAINTALVEIPCFTTLSLPGFE